MLDELQIDDVIQGMTECHAGLGGGEASPPSLSRFKKLSLDH